MQHLRENNGTSLSTPSSSATIVDVQGLRVSFQSQGRVVRAVNNVSFELQKGETLCLVGESGCGKSVTAMSIMRLLPQPPARFDGGHIFFEGRNVMSLSEKEMRALRGNRMAMIFQSPITSLNPLLTIGRQITEGLEKHQHLSSREAAQYAMNFLSKVRIPDPKRVMKQFPHELSGGMCQRIMIAVALSSNPDVLIADEPTTALDVTIQAQILSILSELQADFKTALLMITHDLGVVAEMADRVLVMYAGSIVEAAEINPLFSHPAHPYTIGLMRSMPRVQTINFEDHDRRRLNEIKGVVPDLSDIMIGCTFAPRCDWVTARCRKETPALTPARTNHWAACWEMRKVQESTHV
jgi:peptide/nickel transport system ATP-binding protein